MSPIFHESSFKFSDPAEVPDHIEGSPNPYAHGDDQWGLMGHDTFAGESYPLASHIDDLPTAKALKQAREAHLDETQPRSSSGGKPPDGIQDTVYIVQPKVA